MSAFFIFVAIVVLTISCDFSNIPRMSPINLSKALSEQNSLLPVRLLRGQAWLAGIVVLLLCSNTFAESDFSAFWQKLKAAVIAGDKVAVAEMTKFPLSMPYEVKAVKNKEGLSRRYNEIFKGEANAAQCFARGEPRKESAGHYEIYCPFKKTPEDRENAPIRFIFELTNGSWKFAGLDNVNE